MDWTIRDYDKMQVFSTIDDHFVNGPYDPQASREKVLASTTPQLGNAPSDKILPKPMHDSVVGGSVGTSSRDRTYITLDPDIVGWVIGKHGAHIKEMKQTTGCVMWLNQSNLRLHIVGSDKHQEEMALALVEDLIRTAPVREANMGQETTNDFTTKMIDCPADRTGLLIGRNGSNIKRMKELFKVSIIINQVMEKAIICGSEKDAENAATAIQKIFMYSTSLKNETGVYKSHNGQFSPIQTPASAGSISTTTSITEDPFRKHNSFFSLLTNPLYNGENLTGLVTPSDFFDKPLDNFSLFDSANDLTIQDEKVAYGGWAGRSNCSTPTSQNNTCSVTSSLGSSIEKEPGKRLLPTPTTVDNAEPLSNSGSFTQTTQVDFMSVEEFLRSINLLHHLSVFKSNEMDMEALRLSSKEDLRALGLPIGASIKIAAALKML